MKTISLKLPIALNAKLKLVAKRRNTNRSAIVREALEMYLNRKEKPLRGSFTDLAGDLIGCLDGGPGELAHIRSIWKALADNSHDPNDVTFSTGG